MSNKITLRATVCQVVTLNDQPVENVDKFIFNNTKEVSFLVDENELLNSKFVTIKNFEIVFEKEIHVSVNEAKEVFVNGQLVDNSSNFYIVQCSPRDFTLLSTPHSWATCILLRDSGHTYQHKILRDKFTLSYDDEMKCTENHTFRLEGFKCDKINIPDIYPIITMKKDQDVREIYEIVMDNDPPRVWIQRK